MSIVMNGKVIASECEEKMKERVVALKERLNFTPTLATIIVGEDVASVTYVNMKAKACERVGLGSKIVRLSENSSTEDLLTEIKRLNEDSTICGILLQHPVPKHIDERKCFDAIAIEKDVDGVNSQTFGKLALGEKSYLPATPYGIMRLLEYYGIELEGKNAVVVGRSAILGKPIAMLLLASNCTVTICHSKTKNLPEICKTADIIIGAVGKPKFIKKEWLKEGVVLVDAGYNAGNVGDIDLENCAGIASAYTPVPGGVGPMTINSLILQTLESAEKMSN